MLLFSVGVAHRRGGGLGPPTPSAQAIASWQPSPPPLTPPLANNLIPRPCANPPPL